MSGPIINSYSFSHIPDFLSDHTLLADDKRGRLAETMRRWELLVQSLWLFGEETAFQIRITSKPSDDLLGLRLVTGIGSALAPDAADVRRHTELLLAQLKLPFVREAGIRSTYSAKASSLSVFEIHQAERMIPSGNLHDRSISYVVMPWWGPGGSFLGPIHAINAVSAEVEIIVTLKPTCAESTVSALGWYAKMMATRGDVNRQAAIAGAAGNAMHFQEHDPLAQWIGRIHAANFRRLHRPYIVVCHVVSTEPTAAKMVAMATAATINSETPFEIPFGESTPMDSLADVVELQHDEIQDFAVKVDNCEVFRARECKWNKDIKGLGELRYLADARGASTVFRLPVSTEGGIPGIKVIQQSPSFHLGPRGACAPSGEIEIGLTEGGAIASVPIEDIAKHVLVTGFTGSGKTVTVMNLLRELWVEYEIPFLVLESAKQEYRTLLKSDAFQKVLRVYTAGNEPCAPLRLNPFEVLPGTRVEAHMSRLQVCFEAAVPPIGPSASVIAEGLLLTYREFGWALHEIVPLDSASRRPFPRMRDFIKRIEWVISSRGYEGEVLANLRAALLGRFKPLLIGSKGLMFDAETSSPSISDLLEFPTIVELNDLNVDDKALVVMFMLVFLREYRESKAMNSQRTGLSHVTVIEEAHNILENVESKGSGEGATSADTRYKAVEAFCSLLTEIRALGEGLVISDQSPTKLASDAIRNTNLQIAHQLRDSEDRAAIAKAMIMTEEQRDYLGKLRPGCAAVFRTGFERATFVTVRDRLGEQTRVIRRSVPPVALGSRSRERITDGEVRTRMELLDADFRRRTGRTHGGFMAGCEWCANQCIHKDAIFPELETERGVADLRQWDDAIRDEAGVTQSSLWELCARLAMQGAQRVETQAPSGDAPWCYFVNMWFRRFGRAEVPLSKYAYQEFHRALENARAQLKR